MKYSYPFSPSINLYVEERITRDDANRQERTAAEILKRLEKQPGVILADEVGMGKTFVALSVAASVALNAPQRRPVVVMVPPSLREKWPKELNLFKSKCLDNNSDHELSYGSAESAVDFLKLLDDKESIRVSVIFLTHGAMNPKRKLQDGWVKLALIQRAMYRRKDVDYLKRAICRCAGDLLRMKWVTNRSENIWEKLIYSKPSRWLKILRDHDLEPKDKDDPVPEAVLDAMGDMDLRELYYGLKENIPIRMSAKYNHRLASARNVISNQIAALWYNCISSLNIKLPLLIFDEAHHLKNAHTQLASLFHSKEYEEDAEEVHSGPLAGVFERMLFLTATPFQLGHYELCSVLNRFNGISWNTRRAPSIGRRGFADALTSISQKLDAAQEAAVRLDYQWGQLKSEDLTVDDNSFSSISEWWLQARTGGQLTPSAQEVMKRFNQTKLRMQDAKCVLRPYIIRHSRTPHLPTPFETTLRRERYTGRAIISEELINEDIGLDIQGQSLLPFLLAARVTALKPDERPVFAEGLASSYEAFLHTRQQRIERIEQSGINSVTDGDDDAVMPVVGDGAAQWYLAKLEAVLSDHAMKSVDAHPKLESTVRKAVELWKAGEKVLIFCHYLKTGSILEEKIAEAIKRDINRTAARKLNTGAHKAADELERLGQRFFDSDSPVRRGFDKAIKSILAEYPDLQESKETIIEICKRYIRTPSFLTRFFPLGEERLTEKSVFRALRSKDYSGLTLESLLRHFFKFLVTHCGPSERQDYIRALESIQTGSIVRLANGNTTSETRQRLMLTFNTPFYPEILVASMIMAEGVDLHLNCRYIIHHDLCWNPSTLEQRTGRLDRIGAKGERCGMPIAIYLPYIAQTQDEKMYRVVMDRERWFKVVMGENYKVDARTTEKLAERLPFPEEAASELIFRLHI